MSDEPNPDAMTTPVQPQATERRSLTSERDHYTVLRVHVPAQTRLPAGDDWTPRTRRHAHAPAELKIVCADPDAVVAADNIVTLLQVLYDHGMHDPQVLEVILEATGHPRVEHSQYSTRPESRTLESVDHDS